jgi:hypothetical protein
VEDAAGLALGHGATTGQSTTLNVNGSKVAELFWKFVPTVTFRPAYQNGPSK